MNLWFLKVFIVRGNMKQIEAMGRREMILSGNIFKCIIEYSLEFYPFSLSLQKQMYLWHCPFLMEKSNNLLSTPIFRTSHTTAINLSLEPMPNIPLTPYFSQVEAFTILSTHVAWIPTSAVTSLLPGIPSLCPIPAYQSQIQSQRPITDTLPSVKISCPYSLWCF